MAAPQLKRGVMDEEDNHNVYCWRRNTAELGNKSNRFNIVLIMDFLSISQIPFPNPTPSSTEYIPYQS